MFALQRSLVLAALCWALTAGAAASAALPTGPRLAFVEWLPAAPMTHLVTVAADGGGRRTLPLEGVMPAPFSGPAWSADGTALIFAGLRTGAGGELRDNARTWLFAIGAEGGAPRRLPGTAGAGSPVLSPDGATVAFERFRIRNRYDPRMPLKSGVSLRSSAWSVPAAGGSARQLTPWRRGLTVRPASFSPDGSTLLLERDRGSGRSPEVVALEPGRRTLRVLLPDAEQPSYSPDGARIAFVSYRDRLLARGPTGLEPVAELYLSDADGTRLRRLTRSPGLQESQPAWSLDGTRIAYLRARGPAGLGAGTELRTITPDGSCGRRVAGAMSRRSALFHGPVWQPGPGRGTGPFSC